MKTTITYKDLVSMHPCYPPEDIGIKKGFSMSIPDFITEYRNKVNNKEDIMWVLCRNEYMSERDMRLFAVWCARKALKLIDDPDPKSINVCDVAERYANGNTNKEELYTAREAARNAGRTAAWDAARAAAWNAAREAAEDAARAAAWNAARAAAWNAAWNAARDTTWTAVWDTAKEAARTAARDAQIDKILTYFK